MPIRPIKFISIDGTIKQAQGVISTTVGAGPVESQLVTFSTIPTGGSWILGMSGNPGNYATLSYNDDATAVQTALRAISPVTTAWGANLTVTGNYTIGFTIQASQYGNLETLYISDNQLVYNTSMGGYATNTNAAWSNYDNALGSPDGVYATQNIVPTSTSSLIVYFDGVFDSMPTVAPTQWVVTAYHASNNDIYEYTNSSSFSATGIGSVSFGSNAVAWSSDSNQWSGTNFGGNDSQWGTAYTNTGSLYVTITLRNQDETYEKQATIDAVYLQLYYNAGVTMSISTITDG